MPYSDPLRTKTWTAQDLASLLDGIFGAAGPLGESSAWSPSHTGFSADPTVVARYWQIGKLVIATYSTHALGTSNLNIYTVSAPVGAKVRTNQFFRSPLTQMVNNGATTTSPGEVTITSGATNFELTFNPDGVTLWHPSGLKGATFSIIYEAA